MKSSRSQFYALFLFLGALALVLSNGFVARVFAQDDDVDIAEALAPMAHVFDEILTLYVEHPDVEKVVEGALKGMMNELDEHSSFISRDAFDQIQEDTEGEFDGIGVSIQLDESQRIKVMQPMAGSPAFKEGILGGDIIVRIDGVSTEDMAIDEAAKRIRGPSGTPVEITVWRQYESDDMESEILSFKIKRGKIPLESIIESRIINDTVGYIRLADFKKTSARDLEAEILTMQENGMESLILDLRWNPGGLLTAAREVCEVFLPKNTLVTYTKGRPHLGTSEEDLKLFTESRPAVPDTLPIILLVNGYTASSSEIVTGALQYYKRGLVLGMTTYGKGSVQTIIPLDQPLGSALRLTTALYYTPARVTINKRGIRPDIEVEVPADDVARLYVQLRDSYLADPALKNRQNHGPVTGDGLDDNGNPIEGTVNDVQLERALAILSEDKVFEHLVEKYHKPTDETQVAVIEKAGDSTPHDGVTAGAATETP